MKAIVTGGAGFIGSHLVDSLISDGHEVLVIDDFSSGKEENLKDAANSGKLTIEKIDLCDNALEQKIIDFGPEVTFHLAAQMNVRKSVADPKFDARVNVEGTVSILEACRKVGCKKVIFSSTGGAIYGEQEQFPASESHINAPKSPYGQSKKAAELYLDFYSREYGMHSISLRFANVYGPRQNPKGEAGVVAIFCEKLIKSEPLTVYGTGEQTRDFVHVSDVVSACRLASKLESSAGKFELFNVGLGVESSVNDIAKHLKKLWQKDIENLHKDALPGEQMRSVIDSSKLKNELSWSPKYNLETGLKSTLDSYI